MEGKFKPSKYKDQYLLKLKAAIKKKAKGGKIRAEPKSAEKKSNKKIIETSAPTALKTLVQSITPKTSQ